MTLPPLRTYQELGLREVTDAAIELARSKRGYGILAVAPTGAGKTRMGLELCLRAIAKRGRALWIAPRNELVEQPVKRLRSFGQNVRALYDGRDDGDPGAELVVASIQTLVARDMTPPAEVVILDEARHYVASEWGRIAGHYQDVVRVGLDATPSRADGRPLGDLFDRIVPISSVAELTELGHLVPARIIGPRESTKVLSCSPVDAWFEDAAGKRSLVFMASIAEAEMVAADFRAEDVPAIALSAKSSLDERREALDRMRRGELLVIVNCLLFTEGLDLPELESIIIARGVSHPSTWIQIGGRGLRPSPHTGKTCCIISDLRGHFHKRDFGPLDDPRRWSLEGKPIATEEGLSSPRQCEMCHGWFRGRVCAACGHVNAPLQEAAEVKVKPRERVELTAIPSVPVKERFAFYSELVRQARARGYKMGWVSHRYKARFKRWPGFSPDDVEELGEARS